MERSTAAAAAAAVEVGRGAVGVGVGGIGRQVGIHLRRSVEMYTPAASESVALPLVHADVVRFRFRRSRFSRIVECDLKTNMIKASNTAITARTRHA